MILIGLVFALIIQSLAANLGVCTGKIQDALILTFQMILYFCVYVHFKLHLLVIIILTIYLSWAGKHLSEICKAEYPLLVKYCLWLLAEAAVIAADIPEGTYLFSIFLFFVFSLSIIIIQFNNKIHFVF